MERTILRYAPDNWDTHSTILRKEFLINEFSEEYKQIAFEVKKAAQNNNLNIKSIKRNQNIHDFGQLIIREQLLAVSNVLRSYYRVRRCITINKSYLNNALDYNIDPRRCGMSSLSFAKFVNCSYNEIILVVQVVTTDHDAYLITPKNSSEYFIDYIVDIN